MRISRSYVVFLQMSVIDRNCTTSGIFALCAFSSQNHERIVPGNKRKSPGKKRK